MSKLELNLARLIAHESRMMKLTRELFLGRVFSSLSDAEKELVEYAVEKKWLKVELEPNVRVIVQGESKLRSLVALDQTPEEIHVENCLAKDRENYPPMVHLGDGPPQWHIIWPEDLLVTGEQLLRWATDDVDNGLTELPRPVTTADAIEILKDTGSVTFGDS